MRREKITQVDKALGRAVLDATSEFSTPDIHEMLVHTYTIAQGRRKTRSERRRKVFILVALGVFVAIAGMQIVSLIH